MNNGKYNAEIVKEICGYIKQGDSNITAARKAGIAEDTFYDWLKVHSEFSEAIKEAREEYRRWELNGILESAKSGLKTLVEGCEYDEVTTEYIADPDDPNKPLIRQQRRVHKKILPNPTSVIFALTNRDPENWQNKYSADVRASVESSSKVSLADVPDDLLEQVVRCINKESN